MQAGTSVKACRSFKVESNLQETETKSLPENGSTEKSPLLKKSPSNFSLFQQSTTIKKWIVAIVTIKNEKTGKNLFLDEYKNCHYLISDKLENVQNEINSSIRCSSNSSSREIFIFTARLQKQVKDTDYEALREVCFQQASNGNFTEHSNFTIPIIQNSPCLVM